MKDYWIGGWHAVEHLLAAAPERVIEVLVSDDRDDGRARRVVSLAGEAGRPLHRVARPQLGKRVGDIPHQGVAALLTPAAEPVEEDLYQHIEQALAPLLLLVLDEVSDPRNFGACLRVADGAGVDAVVVPKRRSAPNSAVVHKAASGAAEIVPVYRVTNLRRTLDELKSLGVWLYGLTDDATTQWHELDLTQSAAIVLGAEGAGMRRLTRESCDALAAIPMAGVASSLNVSVAAGVALFEARRQRGPVAVAASERG